MRFGELCIPDVVLDALENNELLIFAGAGVSLGGTAQYPDFKGLIHMIEHNSGRVWSGENFDYYLGALEHAGVNVHKAAKQILTRPTSKPNPIHQSIMRLFKDEKSVRIVTTNFDKHFSSVAKTCFADTVKEFVAPALPVGNNFSGIVYVHGSVIDRAENLVLTDRDFGKAYSTEGWARRFLVDAFRKYTVLFVGYSHNDPPMLYLTRGLTPEADKLYAISRDCDEDHWRHLGIHPISYRPRKVEPKHIEIEKGFQKWEKYAKMSILDHKAKLSKLLKKKPDKLTSHEDSYIQKCFQNRNLLQFFYEDGLEVDWLLWAEKSDLLHSAFLPGLLELGQAAHARNVAHWFSKHAVYNHNEAVAVYMRTDMVMPEHLWYQIGQAYHSEKQGHQEGRAIWAAQLCMHWQPGFSAHYLEYAMQKSAENGDYDTSLMILEFLCTPRIIHKRAIVHSDPAEENRTRPKVQMIAKREAYWMKKLWELHLQDKLDKYALRLIEMTTSKLELAHELQLVHAIANKEFDEISWNRSAIEPNHQDNDYQTGFNLLVDLARDSFEYLLEAKRTLAIALRLRWIVARSPLLKRLAIHGMGIDTRISKDKKLQWSIEHDLYANISLHHEFFMFVSNAYPHTKSKTQNEFLKYIRKVTLKEIQDNPEQDEGMFWHSEFTLLSHLNTKMEGNCPIIQKNLATIKKRYPDFKVSDHPEFTHYSYGVQSGWKSPIDEEGLRTKPIKEAVRFLVNFKSKEWRGPRRDGLMQTLFKTVNKYPEWGLELAQNLIKRKRYPDDIWPSIINGWHALDLNEKMWDDIIALLQRMNSERLPLREIAQLLYWGIRDDHGLSKSTIIQAEKLALSVLACARKTKITEPSKDWYSWAINTTGGIICQFIVYAMSKLNPKNQTLPTRYKKQFNRMLSGRTLSDQAGRTILASYLHFMYAKDPSWVDDSLIPAFDWEANILKATQIWHGYLGNGKWSNTYLQKILRYYIQSVKYIKNDGPLRAYTRQFSQHVASICLLSKSKRANNMLLIPFFKQTTIEEHVFFANTIRSIIKEQPENKRHMIWVKWAQPYWKNRSLGKPIPLSPEETKAMILWCPLFENDFPEVIQLLTQTKVSIGTDLFCLSRFKKSGLHEKFPDTTAHLLHYLLQNHGDDFFYSKELLEICKDLIFVNSTHSLLFEIMNQLASQGCISEAEELNQLLLN
jgi:SIR2-like protein